jgi:hypothetical protein
LVHEQSGTELYRKNRPLLARIWNAEAENLLATDQETYAGATDFATAHTPHLDTSCKAAIHLEQQPSNRDMARKLPPFLTGLSDRPALLLQGSSSIDRGQLFLSSRESARSARMRPPVWQRAQ